MKLSIGIHQPNYFPWLGYFHKIKLSDKFVFLDTVDIQIKSFDSLTNRTRIKTKQGVQWLTVPIRKGNSKKIKDILIDNSLLWKRKHLNTVFHAYKKALFFEETYTGLENLLSNDFEKLAALNITCIMYICKHLQINTVMVPASALPDQGNDKNGRLISICKTLKGNIYLSGEGGKKYNDENLFSVNQIRIDYTQYSLPHYKQLYNEFISGLSIIDALFNCGNDTLHLI